MKTSTVLNERCKVSKTPQRKAFDNYEAWRVCCKAQHVHWTRG